MLLVIVSAVVSGTCTSSRKHSTVHPVLVRYRIHMESSVQLLWSVASSPIRARTGEEDSSWTAFSSINCPTAFTIPVEVAADLMYHLNLSEGLG